MRKSYGDVLAEQRAISESVAMVEGAHDLVWVEGRDAVSFLDGILSQDISAMEPGTVARSFLLQPQGKLRHLLWVARGHEKVGLIADAGRGSDLQQDLAYYRIRVKADIRAEERPVVSLWGPNARNLLGLGPFWADDRGRCAIPFPMPGVDRVVVAGDLALSGYPMAGDLAVTAVRVGAGEPLMGRDVDESTIPQETGLVDDAVSFTKGCYLGQELVARIDSRGRVNRHLRGLVLQHNLLPPERAAVVVDGTEVGVITSVSESLALQAPVGLGLIRREVEPGDTVEIRWEGGEAGAIIRSLPMVAAPS